MRFEFTIVGIIEAGNKDEAELMLRTTIEEVVDEMTIEDLYEADE